MSIIVLAIVILLALSAPAEAGFLVPFLFPALTGFALTATQFAVNLAVGLGLSFVAGKLLAKKSQGQVGGAQLSIQMAADVPQSLLVGRAVTAGSLVYAKTFGKRGDIDNSDLIEIIALADHRCHGLVQVYVEGQAVTLQSPSGDRGQVVDGYNNKLAIKFYDGSQTGADAFAVSKLGTASDQPWTTSHIGTSTAYVRVHSIYNQNKVPGRLRWKFVVDGVKLYDPRKDSSVGGSGAHRFDTLSTHEWSDNVAVIAYNILRGVYVPDVNGSRQFVYGLEGTGSDQLPLDVWFAAMNECDVLVDGEKQYRCGGEITIDSEPLEVVRELLKASGGRLVENGGVYKLYIGAPGLPVLSFDDGALVANREDQFKPVLTLENRVNAITGKYISPDDGWIPKVAPKRANLDWREEDGRELPADLDCQMVQSGRQLQQLQLQLLNRSRRQRKHALTLPPSCMALEPGDVVSWTSVRNGYEDKLFEVDGVDYEANCCVTIAVTEVDPSDYDYDSGDLLFESDGLVVTTWPEPKVIGGFGAEGFVYLGDGGTERPAIRLTWDDPEDGDVVAVRYQIRTVANQTDIASGRSDQPDALAMVILGGLQALTDYEVRGQFESFNGYESDWSLWLPVTTPDARIGRADFDDDLDARIRQIEMQFPALLASLRADIDSLAGALTEQTATLLERGGQTLIGLGARYAENAASISQVALASAEADEAQAALITGLDVRLDDAESDIVGQSSAISALDTRVTSAEGVNTSQSTAITALQSGLSTTSGQVVAQAGSINALSTLVVQQGGTLTTQADSITLVETRLTDAESGIAGQSSAISTLDSRITSAEGTITSQGTAITAVQADALTMSGQVVAQANSINALGALIVQHGETLQAQSEAVTSVEATIDDATAGGLFRMVSTASEGDALSTIDLQTRASIEGAFASAGMKIASYAVEGGGTSSVIQLTADHTQIGLPGQAGGEFRPLLEAGTVNGQPGIVLHGGIFADDGIGSTALAQGAATTVGYRAQPGDDISRTRSAWNNSGNGETLATITVALVGDGATEIYFGAALTSSSSAGGDDWIAILADGVEIARRSMSSPDDGAYRNTQVDVHLATDALPPGTNVLQAKMYIENINAPNQTVSAAEIRWLIKEHHKPSIQVDGAATATVNYLTMLTDAGSANDVTFSGVSIGTASPTRMVVLALGYMANAEGYKVKGVTIGGVTASRVLHYSLPNTWYVGQIWQAAVPTGTTADVFIDTYGSVQDLSIAVYALTTAAQGTVDVDATGSYGGGTLTLSDLSVQKDGVAIAFAYGHNVNTFSMGWSGPDSLTEHAEGDNGDHYSAHSMATTANSTTNDLTLTYSGSSTQRVLMVAASWR